MADRKLVVQIVGDSRSLERAFSRSSRAGKNWGDSMQRAARGGVVATVGFRGLGRSVAFASASFLGGAGFVAGARAAIGAASDLNEEVNKSRVLFGQSAGEIRKFSKTTATTLGISERAALQFAGAFGGMFATLKLGDDVSAQMSRRLVILGADLASFNNQDPSDMLDRLRSGLAGEAEPLRRFGVLLSAARVEQEAYSSGIAKVGERLTEQQKVQARFNLIFKDTVKAQGDASRTLQEQAGQERVNAALREQAAQRIGKVLLPAYNQATRAVNKWLGEEKNLVRVQKATKDALKIGTDVARAFRDVIETMAPVVRRVNRLLGGTESSVKLLLAVMVAAKIVAFGTAITGLSSAALVATGRVTALRFALLRLGGIGAIAITFDLLIHKNEVDDWMERHGLGFFKGSGIDVFKRLIPRVPVLRRAAAIFEDDESGEAPRKSRGGSLRGPALKEKEREAKKDSAGATSAAARIAATRKAEASAAARAAAQAKRAREKTIEAFGVLMDSLGLAAERAAVTKSFQDDLKVLNQQEAAIRAEIKVEGRTTDLLRELFRIEQERKAISEQIRQQRVDRRKGRQFEALGLTAEGAERVPGVGALRKRLGTLRSQIEGTILDTPKTQAQLARIAKVLAGKFGKVGRDVRSAIQQMFADISGALSGDTPSGPLTKAKKLNANKILAGLGLDENEMRALRSRLSQSTTANLPTGRGPRLPTSTTGGGVGRSIIENHIHVYLDGQQIESRVTRRQQNKNRRNGGSRAGVRPGEK